MINDVRDTIFRIQDFAGFVIFSLGELSALFAVLPRQTPFFASAI
jgi:hypothetical protein